MAKNKDTRSESDKLNELVAKTLDENGYREFLNHKEQAFENRSHIGGKQYLRQLPTGKNIYDATRKTDFLIVNRKKFPNDLIIECKWQEKSGSVDEKYPFLLFNIQKTGVPTLVLIDGGGYRPAALKWLKAQVNPQNHLVAVWDMEEFKVKTSRNFF